MNGIIFDIKEFSIYDGPGGRITVFMKGCPLRCLWCHNPEGLEMRPQILFKKNLCCHCGRCRMGCGHEECKSFDRCIHACSNGCIEVSGKKISSDELIFDLKKKEQILTELNGGVTFSGGEPMMQADFVCETADGLGNIHKAIQTSGYADAETYKRVVDRFDYIMQDIKLADNDEHIKYTGVSNRKILKNIEYLKHSGKEFVFRMPVIPGITDTEHNLAAVSEIAGDFRTELLSYNEFAGAKYEMLGRKYQLDGIVNTKKDCLSYFKNAVVK